MNSVILIGRLSTEPELKFSQGGKAVCKFNIAVNRPFSKEKEADFFRVTVFGKIGENAANYLAKGRLVGIKGRLQNNNYETQTGEKKYTTEVVADQVEFLEWGSKDKQEGQYEGFTAIDEDDPDIPF